MYGKRLFQNLGSPVFLDTITQGFLSLLILILSFIASCICVLMNIGVRTHKIFHVHTFDAVPSLDACSIGCTSLDQSGEQSMCLCLVEWRMPILNESIAIVSGFGF